MNDTTFNGDYTVWEKKKKKKIFFFNLISLIICAGLYIGTIQMWLSLNAKNILTDVTIHLLWIFQIRECRGKYTLVLISAVYGKRWTTPFTYYSTIVWTIFSSKQIKIERGTYLNCVFK